MKNTILALVIIVGLGLAGCFSTGSSSSDSCPDGDVCGNGCMPTGASCCADGSGYCDSGSTCNSSNRCVSSGGGGGGGDGSLATNCVCPGQNECSQLVACVQTCTCYYTINGSDGTSGWALVKRNYSERGTCYMCTQNGLSYTCSQATIDAAAAEAANLILAGECDYL